MPGKTARGRLGLGLDSEVYAVAIRLLEDPNLEADVGPLYKAIQRSNSSLKRKPKKAIEDSLGRVLDLLAEDEDDDEEGPIERQTLQDQSAESANFMNKSITAAWRTSTPAPASPAPERPATDPTDSRTVNGGGEPPRKRRRQAAEPDRSPPSYDLRDLGGVNGAIQQLKELLVLPLMRPSSYAALGLAIPRGILLHGPSGCGKSSLARGFAAALDVPFIEILGPSIVSGMSGESEKQLRDHFEEARRLAPCLIFIDEIDVIAPKRESSQSQMEKRIVGQLLVSMDSLAPGNKASKDEKPVMVIAATNRPDSLDPALRRGGRFDTEICMGVPTEQTRASILEAQTRNTPLGPDVDFTTLAKMTPGFVGADLHDLVGKAGSYTLKRYEQALEAQAQASTDLMPIDSAPAATSSADAQVQSLLNLVSRLKDTELPEPPGFDNISIPMDAFLAVLPDIVPSAKREGFATVPNTTWAHVGALGAIREELQHSIVDPIRDPSRYESVGISVPTGVLLWGPPGCGKTLLAKAVAAESKANFISVGAPDLLHKYVGESERAVRTLFMRARSSVPCIIFFDEFDALVPKRDGAMSEATTRVVNTLLAEMDGLPTRSGIYLVAATNRPDMVDGSVLRPGRFGTLLYVDLPGPEERVDILRALIANMKKVTFPAGAEEIGKSEKCHGFSGADLSALLRQAGMNAINRQSAMISMEDMERAMESTRASVTNMAWYEKLKTTLKVRA